MVHTGFTRMFVPRYGRYEVRGRTTTEAADITELAISISNNYGPEKVQDFSKEKHFRGGGLH